MRTRFATPLTTALALSLTFGPAAPALADDIEDSLKAALEAYQAGDVKTAKEEADFASQLLGQKKAEGLKEYLPDAMQGWERTDGDVNTAGMGAFGGGQMANAVYSKDGDRVEVQIMANNQMVAAMAPMFSNPMLMGAAGKVTRINRQKAIVTPEGEIQALIDGRILIQISGSAPVADKEAYFALIDIDALKEF